MWNNGEKKSQTRRERVGGIVTVMCEIVGKRRAKKGGKWLEEVPKIKGND